MSAGTGLDLIRRGGPVPYYAQLAEILRDRIAGLGPGDALPAESELCRTFGLSRTVVRQALSELVAEGRVQKMKGRGTFVSAPKLADFVVQELRGFSDEMGSHGHAVGTYILRLQIELAPPQVARDLGCDPDSKVVHLARVRTANSEPIVKVDTYLPAPRFERLAAMDLSLRSLYDTLREEFGVRPGGGWRRIEAASASRELADALGVDIGSPMLELVAVTTDQDGIPFEFFRAYYRGDRAGFEVRV